MTERERIAGLVRRARLRLEALRLLRDAARGALLAGVPALATVLVLKLRGIDAAALPWAVVAAGALAGAVRSLFRPRLTPADAALYLDRRLGTDERLVTVLVCPEGPFTDHAARALASTRRLPRLPFPKEATWVPLALFAVFAAGLLPAAGAAAPAPPLHAVPVETADAAGTGVAEPPPPEIAQETIDRLKEGGVPQGPEAAALAEALERGLHRPEDRAAAREALERARGGDGDAAREIGETVSALQGGEGAPGEGEAPGAAPRAEKRAGVLVQGSPYPGAEEFVDAYRRALARRLEERR